MMACGILASSVSLAETSDHSSMPYLEVGVYSSRANFEYTEGFGKTNSNVRICGSSEAALVSTAGDIFATSFSADSALEENIFLSAMSSLRYALIKGLLSNKLGLDVMGIMTALASEAVLSFIIRKHSWYSSLVIGVSSLERKKFASLSRDISGVDIMDEDEANTFDHDTIQSIPALKQIKPSDGHRLKTFSEFNYSSLLKVTKAQVNIVSSKEEWLDGMI